MNNVYNSRKHRHKNITDVENNAVSKNFKMRSLFVSRSCSVAFEVHLEFMQAISLFAH